MLNNLYKLKVLNESPKDWIAYSLLLLISIAIAFLMTNKDLEGAIIALILIIGIPSFLYMLISLKFGVIILFVFSFFLARLGYFFIKGFPLGTLLDVFLFVMLMGLVIRKVKRGDFRIASGPISYIIWIWIIYNVLQVFNPMQSWEAWLYAVRGMAGHMLFYFILLEVLHDFDFLKKLIVLWILLSLIGAIYGLFQEFHGLLEMEKNWIVNDPERLRLYYNWGRFRIFSFFNDPTVFGILMVATSIFCLAISNLRSISILGKLFLVVISGLMFLSAIYSGTRTAYVMLPAGFFFYTVITMQRRVLLIASLIFGCGLFVIYSDIKSVGPILGTNSLERIRSAFNPSDDPSYLVREENQERIKPFIQSHPFGAGIGSIGIWGQRFTPNSPLADFAPDSAYVRIAVELGWIGLVIYTILLATIMITGINNYFRMTDPNLKLLLASILAVIYSFLIANYPQQAIIQLPNNFLFYILTAAVVRLPSLEHKLKKYEY